MDPGSTKGKKREDNEQACNAPEKKTREATREAQKGATEARGGLAGLSQKPKHSPSPPSEIRASSPARACCCSSPQQHVMISAN